MFNERLFIWVCAYIIAFIKDFLVSVITLISKIPF